KMRIEADFREFFVLLNKHNVLYLIVGGYAYSFYAEPRFTKDLNIFSRHHFQGRFDSEQGGCGTDAGSQRYRQAPENLKDSSWIFRFF
ncbi:MAG TPA: hypothetical protein PLN10_07895, partial [Candidatus Aminicenantes bacterium]|nr:hypothetical protein [Candidatus Aminicenantes bacterium]